MMDTLCPKDRKEWRRWLQRNHAEKKEIWVIYYKKHSGKRRIPYDDAVEEAICFGWIDGKVRSIDSERFMQRYTPRKANSVWSMANRKRAEKMIKLGKMTQAGRKLIAAAKKSGKWDAAYTSKKMPRMPKDLKAALMKNRKAWNNFRKFAPCYRHGYLWWVLSAKKEDARKRRIRVVVKRSAQNKKPGVP